MTTSIDEAITKRLTEHGIRFTTGRRSVVAALVASDGPMSAAELDNLLSPEVPLSSIYRTLAVLTDADVLTPHLATKGLARYELSEWLTGHHHHLVCTECGSVEDVDVPTEHEQTVQDLVHAITDSAAFTPTNHALEIEGTCAQCR